MLIPDCECLLFSGFDRPFGCMPRVSVGALAAHKLTDMSKASMRPAGGVGFVSSAGISASRQSAQESASRAGAALAISMSLAGVTFQIVHCAVPSELAKWNPTSFLV